MAYGGGGGGTGGAGHNVQCSSKDFDFFYTGLEQGQLLIQKCKGCGTLRPLPSPACGTCRSLDWDAVALAGTGTIYSYVVHYHPPLPGFDSPHPVILADMAEGVRMLGAMDGTPPDQIEIGMPVAVEFIRRGDIATFRFRAA